MHQKWESRWTSRDPKRQFLWEMNESHHSARTELAGEALMRQQIDSMRPAHFPSHSQVSSGNLANT